MARHPVSAHQRNLRHLAVIARCQILFSEISACFTQLKKCPRGFGVVPENTFWPEASHTPICVSKTSRRSRRGRHLTQVPQARGPHRTLSDAFPVSVQEPSGLFHAVLPKGLPVSAGLLKSPHIKGQGGCMKVMQCDRATKRSWDCRDQHVGFFPNGAPWI